MAVHQQALTTVAESETGRTRETRETFFQPKRGVRNFHKLGLAREILEIKVFAKISRYTAAFRHSVLAQGGTEEVEQMQMTCALVFSWSGLHSRCCSQLDGQRLQSRENM